MLKHSNSLTHTFANSLYHTHTHTLKVTMAFGDEAYKRELLVVTAGGVGARGSGGSMQDTTSLLGKFLPELCVVLEFECFYAHQQQQEEEVVGGSTSKYVCGEKCPSIYLPLVVDLGPRYE